MQPMPHDFAADLLAARTDAVLLRQLSRHFGTQLLLGENELPLVRPSLDLMNICFALSEASYTKSTRRLAGVICASESVNALAVWTDRPEDWVVLSSGLLVALRESCESAAGQLSLRREYAGTALAQRIGAQSPMQGGFLCALSSLLFTGAVSFIVGHESGHHVEGHDGYYTAGGVAEVAERATLGAYEQQALELNADITGAARARQVVIRYLAKFLDVRPYTQTQQAEFSRVIALIIYTSTFLSLVVLRPRKSELAEESLGRKSHPPGAVRALWISSLISSAVKAAFAELDELEQRWLRVLSMELAAEATLREGTPEHAIYMSRRSRREPAALRALGIRKMVNDAQLESYMRKLLGISEALKPRLKPRTSTSA